MTPGNSTAPQNEVISGISPVLAYPLIPSLIGLAGPIKPPEKPLDNETHRFLNFFFNLLGL